MGRLGQPSSNSCQPCTQRRALCRMVLGLISLCVLVLLRGWLSGSMSRTPLVITRMSRSVVGGAVAGASSPADDVVVTARGQGHDEASPSLAPKPTEPESENLPPEERRVEANSGPPPKRPLGKRAPLYSSHFCVEETNNLRRMCKFKNVCIEPFDSATLNSTVQTVRILYYKRPFARRGKETAGERMTRGQVSFGGTGNFTELSYELPREFAGLGPYPGHDDVPVYVFEERVGSLYANVFKASATQKEDWHARFNMEMAAYERRRKRCARSSAAQRTPHTAGCVYWGQTSPEGRGGRYLRDESERVVWHRGSSLFFRPRQAQNIGNIITEQLMPSFELMHTLGEVRPQTLLHFTWEEHSIEGATSSFITFNQLKWRQLFTNSNWTLLRSAGGMPRRHDGKFFFTNENDNVNRWAPHPVDVGHYVYQSPDLFLYDLTHRHCFETLLVGTADRDFLGIPTIPPLKPMPHGRGTLIRAFRDFVWARVGFVDRLRSEASTSSSSLVQRDIDMEDANDREYEEKSRRHENSVIRITLNLKHGRRGTENILELENFLRKRYEHTVFHGYELRFTTVEWSVVQTVRQQVMLLAHTDVYVTSAGSGHYYSLFLPDYTSVVHFAPCRAARGAKGLKSWDYAHVVENRRRHPRRKTLGFCWHHEFAVPTAPFVHFRTHPAIVGYNGNAHWTRRYVAEYIEEALLQTIIWRKQRLNRTASSHSRTAADLKRDTLGFDDGDVNSSLERDPILYVSPSTMTEAMRRSNKGSRYVRLDTFTAVAGSAFNYTQQILDEYERGTDKKGEVEVEEKEKEKEKEKEETRARARDRRKVKVNRGARSSHFCVEEHNAAHRMCRIRNLCVEVKSNPDEGDEDIKRFVWHYYAYPHVSLTEYRDIFREEDREGSPEVPPFPKTHPNKFDLPPVNASGSAVSFTYEIFNPAPRTFHPLTRGSLHSSWLETRNERAQRAKWKRRSTETIAAMRRMEDTVFVGQRELHEHENGDEFGFQYSYEASVRPTPSSRGHHPDAALSPNQRVRPWIELAPRPRHYARAHANLRPRRAHGKEKSSRTDGSAVGDEYDDRNGRGYDISILTPRLHVSPIPKSAVRIRGKFALGVMYPFHSESSTSSFLLNSILPLFEVLRSFDAVSTASSKGMSEGVGHLSENDFDERLRFLTPSHPGVVRSRPHLDFCDRDLPSSVEGWASLLSSRSLFASASGSKAKTKRTECTREDGDPLVFLHDLKPGLYCFDNVYAGTGNRGFTGRKSALFYPPRSMGIPHLHPRGNAGTYIQGKGSVLRAFRDFVMDRVVSGGVSQAKSSSIFIRSQIKSSKRLRILVNLCPLRIVDADKMYARIRKRWDGTVVDGFTLEVVRWDTAKKASLKARLNQIARASVFVTTGGLDAYFSSFLPEYSSVVYIPECRGLHPPPESKPNTKAHSKAKTDSFGTMSYEERLDWDGELFRRHEASLAADNHAVLVDHWRGTSVRPGTSIPLNVTAVSMACRRQEAWRMIEENPFFKSSSSGNAYDYDYRRVFNTERVRGRDDVDPAEANAMCWDRESNFLRIIPHVHVRQYAVNSVTAKTGRIKLDMSLLDMYIQDGVFQARDWVDSGPLSFSAPVTSLYGPPWAQWEAKSLTPSPSDDNPLHLQALTSGKLVPRRAQKHLAPVHSFDKRMFAPFHDLYVGRMGDGFSGQATVRRGNPRARLYLEGNDTDLVWNLPRFTRKHKGL